MRIADHNAIRSQLIARNHIGLIMLGYERSRLSLSPRSTLHPLGRDSLKPNSRWQRFFHDEWSGATGCIRRLTSHFSSCRKISLALQFHSRLHGASS